VFGDGTQERLERKNRGNAEMGIDALHIFQNGIAVEKSRLRH
jgi:hypothetical protein